MEASLLYQLLNLGTLLVKERDIPCHLAEGRNVALAAVDRKMVEDSSHRILGDGRMVGADPAEGDLDIVGSLLLKDKEAVHSTLFPVVGDNLDGVVVATVGIHDREANDFVDGAPGEVYKRHLDEEVDNPSVLEDHSGNMGLQDLYAAVDNAEVAEILPVVLPVVEKVNTSSYAQKNNSPETVAGDSCIPRDQYPNSLSYTLLRESSV